MDAIARQLIARLEVDPGDSAAYDALRARYSELGDFASLANLVEGWAEHNEAQAAAASAAYVEAARAVLTVSTDLPRAERLYRRALELDVNQREAGAGLIGMLEQRDDVQALAQLLDGYARALDAAGTDPAWTAELYLLLAQVLETRFGQPEQAKPYADRAHELGAATLQPPLASAQSDSELQALQEASESETDAIRRLELLSELARLHVDRRDDIESGVNVLRKALASAPGDVQIMHQLASYLLLRADNAPPAAAQADHRRVAELFYQIAQGVDEDRAIEFLESALTSMPTHEGALALLERVAPALGRSEVLPAHWVAYVAHAEVSPDSDARRLLLARAYLDAQQPADAIDCLQPLAERGIDRAHQLLQQAFALEARGGGASGQVAVPATRRGDSEEIAAATRARAASLRKQLHGQVAAREHDAAAETCRALLEIDPNDPEAFGLYESLLRRRRAYPELRDLLLASTRSPGLSVDIRKTRLREVATLSEAKLRDEASAVSAYRGVVTLDPGDRDALRSLKRLLMKAQQWDELAQVLEREALTATSSEEKAGLIHEIALLHRDKRKDPVETAAALRQLHALRPADAAIRDELCALCLQLEQFDEAARLLRERASATSDARERTRALSELARLLHEKLEEPALAYAACEEILAATPNDIATLEQMERIDEELGQFARLIDTLERRAALVARSERPAIFVRMSMIAEERLGDLDGAAEHLGDALDLAPQDGEVLARLVAMFERANRHADLIELLRERCLLEKDSAAKAALLRRIGKLLAERVGDETGAAAEYTRSFELEPSEEAARYLLTVGPGRDDPARRVALLEALEGLTKESGERRDLAFERAILLRDELARPTEALAALRLVVEKLDPSFDRAIAALEALAQEHGDHEALVLALERGLDRTNEAHKRVTIAKRIAQLCEDDQKLSAHAIAALMAWSAANERDPEPRRRLKPRLEADARFAELCTVLDGLGTWEDSLDARDAAIVEAARVSFERLEDPSGAWRRLVPLVEEQNAEAEALLVTVARASGRGAQLAGLYVRLAQAAQDKELIASYWQRAADAFEKDAQNPEQALEAALRRLAADTTSSDALSQVDRLARTTGAQKRLGQVYERLVRDAADDARRIELLVRHANVIESASPDDALDRLLRALELAPADDVLLARAEELAPKRRRSEELLAVFEHRKEQASDDAARVRAVLRAARWCDGALRDRDRANALLASGVPLASSDELVSEIIATARQLDTARPDLGVEQARRSLVRAHRDAADRADNAPFLLLQAAKLLQGELSDERGALDLLRHGVAIRPLDDALYESLCAVAARLKRLDAVDAHLMRLSDESFDPETTTTLLRRRAHLLEDKLGRAKDAAQIYARLLQLRPDDPEATEKLRASLRAHRKFQDLLVMLNRQLQRTKDPEQRLGFLREIALTWERDLKNRWEAFDAWNAVLAQSADDPQALAAVARLERGRGSSPDVDVNAPGAEPVAAENPSASLEPGASTAFADESPALVEASASSGGGDANPAASTPSVEPGTDKPKRGRGRKRKRAEAAEVSDAASSAEPGDSGQNAPPVVQPQSSEPQTHAAASFSAAAAPATSAEPAPLLPPEDSSDDLAALDADLDAAGAGVEEIDLLSTGEVAVDINLDDDDAHEAVSFDDTHEASPVEDITGALPPPLPRQHSAPPPLPPRISAPVPRPSTPPARRASAPPPPPLPSRKA